MDLQIPWQCPECGNTWFYKRKVEQFAKVPFGKYDEPSPYLAPGERFGKIQYICATCNRELKEISE